MVRVLCLLAVLWAIPAHAQTNEEAMAALNAGDYDTSFDMFTRLAATGDASAQSTLAWHYYGGRGVEKNLEQAATLWRQSSDNGFARGTFNLALVTLRGEGVPRDGAAALALYELAGDQGLSDGYFQVGISYQIGRGVGVDPVQAFVWFTKAAEAGNRYAELRRADAFVLGHGMPEDPTRAFRIYRKLNGLRTEENLRMPSMRPRMREVQRKLDGEPWNSEYFRYQAYVPPQPWLSSQQVSRMMGDLKDLRIAARNAQIAAEAAGTPAKPGGSSAMACHIAAPAGGAIVESRQPRSWSLTRAGAKSGPTIRQRHSAAQTRTKGLQIPSDLTFDQAERFRSGTQPGLGRLVIQDRDQNPVGPGWAVSNQRLFLTLGTRGNISLDDRCQHRADEFLDKATCEAEAEASLDALNDAIATDTGGLVLTYFTSPGEVALEMPLQLLSPEVYAEARRLVVDEKRGGLFPIVACPPAQ